MVYFSLECNTLMYWYFLTWGQRVNNININKPGCSVWWQPYKVLRHAFIRKSDVTLWEELSLFNFRSLITYPYNTAIKYGTFYQSRTNHLEDSRGQNQEIILRKNREDSENMALQFTRNMDNSKKPKVRNLYCIKNGRAKNSFIDKFFSSLWFGKNLTVKYHV